jgi:hypothetical protein
MSGYLNCGGSLVVVILRRAGKEDKFVTIPSEKSVLNGPLMASLVSRMSLFALYSIVFVGTAAPRRAGWTSQTIQPWKPMYDVNTEISDSRHTKVTNVCELQSESKGG